jgi:hypothetical protein
VIQKRTKKKKTKRIEQGKNKRQIKRKKEKNNLNIKKIPNIIHQMNDNKEQ